MKKRRKISARDYDATDLSLRSLRIFLCVEESGSMVAAARHLGSSKSMVSQQIANLEKNLGATLIDRDARPMRLTPAGLAFRDHARKILNGVSQARAELVSLNLAAFSELRLGMIDDLDASLTPDLVDHLKDRYPQCWFSATSGLSDGLTTALTQREQDIVVTADPPQSPGEFYIVPLLREPFVLVCTADLPPAEDFNDVILEQPFIRYSDQLPLGRRIEQHLNRLRIAPAGKYSFDASRSVFAMVGKARGWAITTPLCVLDSQDLLRNLEIRPLPAPGLTRTVYLAARRKELGDLPEILAALCRDLLHQRAIEPAIALAPWLKSELRILD